MSEATEAAAPQQHPLDELLTVANRRKSRLGSIKSFDGEQARREFYDNIYPLLVELTQFVGSLDERLADVESGETEVGIPAALANDLLTGIAQGAAMADVAATLLRDDTPDNVKQAVQAARAWYLANGQRLVAEVQSITLADEEPEGQEG